MSIPQRILIDIERATGSVHIQCKAGRIGSCTLAVSTAIQIDGTALTVVVQSRTVGRIVIGCAGNDTGTHYVCSTGACV